MNLIRYKTVPKHIIWITSKLYFRMNKVLHTQKLQVISQVNAKLIKVHAKHEQTYCP